MTSLARIRPSLRRAAFVAALGALMVPATAGAAVHAEASAKKKKVKAPVVTKISPLNVEIGQKIEVRGRYFLRGRNKNTVVFKRTGGKAVFVKADVGTTKLLRLTVPTKLQKQLVTRGTTPLPTRFRVRVLTKKFGKKYTANSKSPVISVATPPPPPGFVESLPDGDCDADGTKNKVDSDDDNDGLSDSVEESLNLNPCKGDTDDNGVEDRYESKVDCDRNGVLNRDESDDDKDLLPDTQEKGLHTNPCAADTDGDGVEDGYEYQSARDLNDDENQTPNDYLPYPYKRPYPNPLFADAGVDYDGDVLTLAEEFRLWKFTYAITGTAQRTLTPLSYSDGEQYTASVRNASGHRQPTLEADTYDKRAQFIAWASMAGYRNVELQDGAPWYDGTQHTLYGLFDTNRRDGESDGERYYNDLDGDGVLSDDERDEDADGLTNYDESHGRMVLAYWTACYEKEKPFQTAYAGVDLADEDSDGDGVRDGADDQDHDDIPNLNELSRIAASGLDDRKAGKVCKPKDSLGQGNFSVTGGPLPDGALVVTFQNELGHQDVDEMTASNEGLTNANAPAVTPTVTVDTRRDGTASDDEQQTVTITGSPTAGSFTLSLEGQSTPPLAWNSDTATVTAALNALVPSNDSNHPTAYGRVNPFNPCLPATFSRTCPSHINSDTGAPFDDSPNWYALQ